MSETIIIPDQPEALKAMVLELLKQVESYRARIESLEQHIRLLKSALFAPKTEKFSAQEDPKQLRLFNEVEILAPQESPEEERQTVGAHTRRRPKRKPLPENLPRIEVIHDIPDGEKVCACGSTLCRIGEEVNEKLDIIPAKIQVIRNIRYKYACKVCEGVEGEGPTVTLAPLPPEVIPKGIATPGLLAHIVISKYADGLPLYRQQKILARYGIEIPRSTMAGWMIQTATALNPIRTLLEKRLLEGPLVNADETKVQVLSEPGRENTSRSTMWVFRGGDPQKPVVLFKYSTTRSGDVAKGVLQDYRGHVQSDGFSGYDTFDAHDSGIRLVGCFVHVRRYFVKVVNALPKSMRDKKGNAHVALDYIRQLYVIENTLREQGLSMDELRDLRRERVEPILAEFKEWLDKKAVQTPPKGLLGQAIHYALTQWEKLVRYLDDGHITPDNNRAENAIRPFVVGRKNWLFCGHPNGAHASATLYSLLETAKACGLEPYAYMRFLLERLPYAVTQEDYAALLPQSVSKEQLASYMARQ